MKLESDSLKTNSRAFYVWHEEFFKNSDNTINLSPQPLAFICNVNVLKLSSSQNFAGFLTDQGYLYYWPWPKTINDRNDIKINPIAITSIDEFIYNLSCGLNHISCTTESNKLYIWVLKNENNFFSLNTEPPVNPHLLNNWDYPISKISSGSNHILVLLSNNDLYCIKLPESSEFKEPTDSELETFKVNITENIIEISAGINISACITESSTAYYWYLERDNDILHSPDKISINKIDFDSIIKNHNCECERCELKIEAISILNDFIALGIIFDCVMKESQSTGSPRLFSHIFLFDLNEKVISPIKYSEKRLFKSIYWLNGYICAIFEDDTIWFRDKTMINDEKNDIVIRPKGDTKLFFASANGRCLIINIEKDIYHTMTNSVEVNGSDKVNCICETEESISKNGNIELLPELNINGTQDKFFPSNTTFETSDQDESNQLEKTKKVEKIENMKSIDQPSYQKPTVSSIMTKKPSRHSFLRKGEGKMKYVCIKNMDVDSKLQPNYFGKCDTINSVSKSTSNLSNSRGKILEYETQITNLKIENKKLWSQIQEINIRYLNDMKSLYSQIKEKKSEKFPLKSIVEQLQKELFIEKEEKTKLKDETETLKQQLQNEITNKNFKHDLLNTQLIIERDKLMKDIESKDKEYQEINNKCNNLEILLTELSSKHNALERDHEKITKKYIEMDQTHTLTVNQLSKSELELYELKKEIETNRGKNASVNELYEYIGELENSLRDLKANRAGVDENDFANSQLIHKNSPSTGNPNTEFSTGDKHEELRDELLQIKDYVDERINFFRETDHKTDSKECKFDVPDSEVCKMIEVLIKTMTEKIEETEASNKSLKKKVNILEKCIKMRRDDIDTLVNKSQITQYL
ncbi:beta-lactamase-inhibitor protein II [Cryptosporidium felis]|nr:beta-lactamase-inhibitor protein II [Cryptosporidium felis]